MKWIKNCVHVVIAAKWFGLIAGIVVVLDILTTIAEEIVVAVYNLKIMLNVIFARAKVVGENVWGIAMKTANTRKEYP